MAWLTGWTYRKSVTLSRASGAVTDYQMYLVVGESSGSIAADEHCEGHALSNFHDLRFTTTDGETLLSYRRKAVWGETPNQIAKITVEFNSIGTDATTFYMYYGKADATDVSDIDGTFLFGDDLSQDSPGGDPSKWSITQGTLSILKVQADAIAQIEKTSCSFNAYALRVAPDGTLWGGHISDGTIRKSTDGGATWTTKYTFAAGSGAIRMIWVASNGYIFASRDDSDILVRSVDGGENWATCKTLSGSGDSVVWHMAEDSDGYIYVGEYSTGPGTEKRAYIYRSANYGTDWTTVWNNPDNDRHIHFVAVDPYTNVLYASQGDSVSRFFKSSNHGDSWTTIGTGSTLWQPTSIAFGSGYRLIGNDNASAPPVCIRKTTDDSSFSDSYTPPSTDDCVFWSGGEEDANGLIVFCSWTQADNERATIVGTKDGGTTWRIFDWEATGVGNRGYMSLSNADPSGFFYVTRSIEGDVARCLMEMSTNNKIKASSADTTQAIGTKTISFPASKFVVEHFAAAGQITSILAPVFVDQDTTDRVSVAFWSDGLIYYHNGTGWTSSGVTYIANRFYKFKYIVHLADGIWDLYIDDVEIATSIPFRNAGTTANNLRITSGANAQGNNYYDDITVRNYSSPEPAWGAWGAEEGLLTKSLSDSFSFTDAIVKSPNLSKADPISLSDAISKGSGKFPSDSITLSDLFSKVWSSSLSLSDVINLSDAISKAVGLIKVDSISLSDSFSRIWAALASLSDQITLTDAIIKKVDLSKSDALLLSDFLTYLKTIRLNFSDVISLSDSISKIFSVVENFKYLNLKLKILSPGTEGSLKFDKLKNMVLPPGTEGDFSYKKMK